MKSNKHNILRGSTLAICHLLCLCFMLGNFSFYLSHSLSDEQVCNEKDQRFEADPCHVRLYHNVHSVKACEHAKHIRQEKVACEFCKNLHSQFQSDNCFTHNCSLKTEQCDLIYQQFTPSLYITSIGGISNKGPPLPTFL
jgi:hypothetical protein